MCRAAQAICSVLPAALMGAEHWATAAPTRTHLGRGGDTRSHEISSGRDAAERSNETQGKDEGAVYVERTHDGGGLGQSGAVWGGRGRSGAVGGGMGQPWTHVERTPTTGEKGSTFLTAFGNL